MSQYFDNDEHLDHKDITVEFTFAGEHYSLKSDKGVFSKDSLDDGTALLLETIFQAALGEEILDLGCGIGPIGLILSRTDPKRHVTLSDVNLRALDLTKANAETLGVLSRVEIIPSDVYTNISSTYDTIVSNPPIRAGKRVTYRIYDEASSYLKDKGQLIIVIRKQQGALSVLAHLRELFPQVDVLAKRKGYLVIAAKKIGATH
jgi:16S rRNA (guanine1207-N2)-methyltransferase